ncbi:hypothetical protein ACMXYX_11130 [Neptuniibacter sp. QD72_48]|uniref:hypothetical protein n=1 Tax=unclassified Neptuniibacter TaxID=2630693 RepID=UPI0039F657A2
MKNLLLISLCLFPLHVIAQDNWSQIEGSYVLTGSELIDPDPSTPLKTHLRFSLTGKVAQDLYQAMDVDVVIDECTGLPSKSVKDMRCYFEKSDDSYLCDFSIDIAEQVIGYGLSC